MLNNWPMALSHLKFRHLMLVELLIQYRTIHKAARQLSVSQPAATAMLQDLENLLGLTLFTRTRQGVTPTEQALAIAGRLRTLLGEFDELHAQVERVAKGLWPLLRVGVVPQAFISYLPTAIELFRNAGGCPIRTQEGTGKQLLDLLIEGELDCVVGRLPSDAAGIAATTRQLNFADLYDEEICIVVGPRNPAATKKKISFQDLAQAEWVMQRPDSSIRRALVDAFLHKGIRLPEPVVETSTYIQNLAVVADTSLVTVAPRRAAQRQQALGLVKILNISLEVSPTRVGLITRKTSSGNAQLVLFREAFLTSIQRSDLIPLR